MTFLGSWLRVAFIDLKLDLRRFAVLLACLTLGVATIATVGSVGAALDGAIGRDARSFLGGDLEASIGYRAALPAERKLFDSFGPVSEVVELASRATAGSGSALVSVRAIDNAYPLVGEVATTPAPGEASPLPVLLGLHDGMFGAIAEPLLFTRLGLKPGDTVRIGNANFVLTGTLGSLPDQAARGFQLGATVLVSTAALPATGALQPGVLARYRYKVDLANSSYAAATAVIKARFGDAGWQLRSPREAAANLTRYLDIFDRFLLLVGLSSLMVGGIGVSNAATAYIGERERSIATMRSLGATGGRIMVHFLTQIMVLGLIGTVAGLIIGAVFTLVLLPLLGSYLTIPLDPAIFPLPLLIAAAFGLVVAFVFAYLPLVRASLLRPASLFRAAGGAGGEHLRLPTLLHPDTSAPLLLGITLLIGLALLTTHQPWLVLWYGVGATVAFLVLRLAALLLQWLLRLLPQATALTTRLALRNIHRRGSPTATVIVSLGLGLTLMLSIALIEASVRDQIGGQLTATAPSLVLINLDKPSVTRLTAFAGNDHRITSLTFTPFLRGIVNKLNGTLVSDLKGFDDVQQRRVGGDQSLSWRADLPKGDLVVEGKWWDKDYRGVPLVSLDQDFARALNLKVGDTMEIAISGRPISVSIANIRHVDWQSGSISFDIVFSPGLIEGAPSTYMGALKTSPGDEAAIEETLIATFPTLDFVPVRDVLAQVSIVIGSLASAVSIVGSVALISGIFVLAGALAAGRRQREADAIVAKVLGATRGQIGIAYLIEYGLLGLLSTLVAANLGAIAAWAVASNVLQLRFALDLALIVEVAFGAVLVTVLTGLVTTWSALTGRPAAFLRDTS
jgi:putative ABC transport system permease protein